MGAPQDWWDGPQEPVQPRAQSSSSIRGIHPLAVAADVRWGHALARPARSWDDGAASSWWAGAQERQKAHLRDTLAHPSDALRCS